MRRFMDDMTFRETEKERTLLWIEPGPAVLVSTCNCGRNNVMTITWTICLDFFGHIALCTNDWNYSYEALRENRECVVAVPPASMAETVVKIGAVSGRDTDKFEKFGLTALPASKVGAPLIGEALANLECRVKELDEKHSLVILEVIKVWEKENPEDTRLFHAFGDGTFAADGEKMNLRRFMENKMPPGL